MGRTGGRKEPIGRVGGGYNLTRLTQPSDGSARLRTTVGDLAVSSRGKTNIAADEKAIHEMQNLQRRQALHRVRKLTGEDQLKFPERAAISDPTITSS